jgi:hypothetical protein
MTPLSDNPFAGLTVIVAPAILTNATSVLCLGTTNRIGRVVDRTRVLRADLARLAPADPARGDHRSQLDRLHTRAQMLLSALRYFYVSIGSFAAAALVSIVGSMAIGASGFWSAPLAILALLAGTLGVAGLVAGCSIMVREVRIAVTFLENEVALAGPSAPAASRPAGDESP